MLVKVVCTFALLAAVTDPADKDMVALVCGAIVPRPFPQFWTVVGAFKHWATLWHLHLRLDLLSHGLTNSRNSWCWKKVQVRRRVILGLGVALNVRLDILVGATGFWLIFQVMQLPMNQIAGTLCEDLYADITPKRWKIFTLCCHVIKRTNARIRVQIPSLFGVPWRVRVLVAKSIKDLQNISEQSVSRYIQVCIPTMKGLDMMRTTICNGPRTNLLRLCICACR